MHKYEKRKTAIHVKWMMLRNSRSKRKGLLAWNFRLAVHQKVTGTRQLTDYHLLQNLVRHMQIWSLHGIYTHNFVFF